MSSDHHEKAVSGDQRGNQNLKQIKRGACLAALSVGAMVFSGAGFAQANEASNDAAKTVQSADSAEAESTQADVGADDGIKRIEAVVVTARRKEESLQVIPVAVSAVGAEMLRDRSLARVDDLQRVVPGLIATPSARGADTPQYMIRGQRGALLPSSLTDGAVATYFDEFTLSRSVGTNQSLFDLESMQVLKGPQGTLFGRNSTGGAILITSNKPTDQFEGYAQVSAGNFDYRDYEGVINIPLGDKAALRAGGKISEREGYMTNVLNGQKANDRDAESYRVSLKLDPTFNLSTNFTGAYYESSGVGFVHKLSAVEPTRAPPIGPFQPAIGAAWVAELAETQAIGEYEYRSPHELTGEDKTASLQNTTTYDLGEVGFLGDVTLKNVIGYREVENHNIMDFFGGGLDTFYVEGNVDNQNFSEEFQLQGETGNLDYIAGLYYFDESANEAGTGRQFAFVQQFVPPFLGELFPIYQNYDYDIDSKSYAAFLHADYDLGALAEGLSVSGGIRLTKDDKTATWRLLNPTSPALDEWVCQADGTITDVFDPSSCTFTATQEGTEPTWDVSLSYQATNDVLIYTSHRRGYRAGGFNQTPQPGIPADFDPEFVKDLELGVKTDFMLGGMSARFNAAAYYQWFTDVQRGFSARLESGGASNISVNAAEAYIYGGEFEFTLKPTDNITLFANYSRMETGYDEWIDTYYDATGNALTVDVSDSKFAGIPQDQLSLAIAYEADLPSGLGAVAANISYYYQSAFETADVNSRGCGPDGLYPHCLNWKGQLPEYDIVNARVDWRDVGGFGFDLGVFVNNLTDEYYEPFATNAIGAIGDQAVGIAPPRMWGAELRVPFGASAY